jgi:hypothetical protein
MFKHLLGAVMETETQHGDVFVAYIGDDGITLKYINDEDEYVCINKKQADIWIYDVSFEDMFCFVLNFIYAGVAPTGSDLKAAFRFTNTKYQSDTYYWACHHGTCVSGS